MRAYHANEHFIRLILSFFRSLESDSSRQSVRMDCVICMCFIHLDLTHSKLVQFGDAKVIPDMLRMGMSIIYMDEMRPIKHELTSNTKYVQRLSRNRISFWQTEWHFLQSLQSIRVRSSWTALISALEIFQVIDSKRYSMHLIPFDLPKIWTHRSTPSIILFAADNMIVTWSSIIIPIARSQNFTKILIFSK